VANPLDPTKPALTDPSIELTAELRAIKQRLVTDKTNIEQLQNTLVTVSGITAFGASLIAAPNIAAAHTVLGFSEVGKLLVEMPSFEDLADELNVQSPIPTLALGSNKWGITLPGGIKINVVVVNCPSAGIDIEWQVPFEFNTFGAVANIYNDVATQPAWTRDHDTAGCFVDHANGSAQTVCVIAIGQ
jgi:hypothetical protein